MAPNKKKKKQSANPARGFATTSIASKPKTNDLALDSEAEGSTIPLTSTETKTDLVKDTEAVQHPAELHELTPEEFEKQLEESELQSLVEQHALKSKRDSARQVTRLQTERRLLRGQTERLRLRQWFPPEATNHIIELIPWNNGHNHSKLDTENSTKTATASEEESSVGLWTLQQTLQALDIPEDKIQQVLQNLIDRRGTYSLTKGAGKDSIWGLEESLDWLALNCNQKDLPSYDEQGSRQQPKQLDGKCSSSIRPEDLSLDSSRNSGTNTPLTELSSSSDQPPVGRNSADLPISVEVDDGLDESDSDIEPDELLPTWLSAKSRLYELRPDLAPDRCTKARTSNSKNLRPISNRDTRFPLQDKLLRRISKIERDVLFDPFEAERRWDDLRKALAQDSVQRRKYGLDDRRPDGPKDCSNDLNGDHKATAQFDTESVASNPGLQEADEDDLLGGLFQNLPESSTDAKTGITSLTVQEQEGVRLTIRDFGKWTGMSPRRIFEEVCRARDSACQVAYEVISSSNFAVRHSVTVTWSKVQDINLDTPFPNLSCVSAQRSVTIAMTSISNPSTVQSEAYISTAALFILYSSSAKEEKAYLRLPSVWRELWFEFAEARKGQIDKIDRENLSKLRDMVRQKTAKDEEDGVVLIDGFRKRNMNMNAANPTPGERPGTPSTVEPIDTVKVREMWAQKASTSSYQRMLTARMQLPMWHFKSEVLEAIERNQVTIICGETGCGKSTQVPAFVLEHELSHGRLCKIYCTEPRRISAISLARRVSEELGERRSDLGTPRSMVGYAIRLENEITSQTRLVYATTGIVMRLVENADDLGSITHLILDEVHERSIESDFLLIVLRKLMVRRPDLKVVLMSATVDAGRFSRYLDGAPVLTVPGRTFPVSTMYLEDAIEFTKYSPDNRRTQVGDSDEPDLEDSSDQKTKAEAAETLHVYSKKTRNTILHFDEYRIDYNLITVLLEKITHAAEYTTYSKAILVFLSGIAEIRRLNDILSSHPSFSEGWYIYALHSSIASEEQEQAFQIPPKGTRKIVLATNIAETGITIPDVTCVIDTGKHKEMRFDERRQLSKLIESFISRANAKQRRGRAGRVQEGICFHLLTKYRHDNQMAEQQTPEMLRLSLQDLVLRVKICKFGSIEQTLLDALDPPLPKNIRRAIDALVDVKALTAAEELTPLGRQLAKLPLDVFLGKLILLGSIFKCMDVTLTIAAILSSKSPFSTPMGARSQADLARLAFKRDDSDLLTVYNAYAAWRRVSNTPGSSEYQFCRKNFLNPQTLANIEDLKIQLVVSMVDAGFLDLDDTEKTSLQRARFSTRQRHFFVIPSSVNINNDNDLIVTSVIAWSFYPKLLVRDGKGWRNVANNQSVQLHPSSVNKRQSSLKWLSYYHIMQSTNKFYNAHETSSVEEFAVALLCGEAEFKMYAGVMIIDGNRIRFSVDDWKMVLALKSLRFHLKEIMSGIFRNPGKRLSVYQQKWFDVWQRIFSGDFQEKH